MNKVKENCKYDLTYYNIVDNSVTPIWEPVDETFGVRDRIVEEVISTMKADSNYEEIQFKNYDKELDAELTKAYVKGGIFSDNGYTYADYLNAVIYDKFVTGDSDFTGIILSNVF